MMIDARIRVHFLDELPRAGQADQVLLLAGEAEPQARRPGPRGWAAVLRLPAGPLAIAPAAGHRPGCGCCGPRPPQAAILRELFHARARGEMGYFRSLAAHLPQPAAAGLRQLLVSDPFLSGCFVAASGPDQDNLLINKAPVQN